MDEKAAEDDAKAAKDRKGAKVVEARRRLTRALRVDKLTKQVEECGTGRVVERRQRGVKPGKVVAKNRQTRRNLKLSLSGSIERHDQHELNG